MQHYDNIEYTYYILFVKQHNVNYQLVMQSV